MVLIILCGCGTSPSLENERAAITALLDMERKAHLEKDVSLFMSEFSDGMISVNRGVVSQPSPEMNRDRIQDYFNRVEFIRWEDTAPATIKFSNDGTLAYAIVQKQVILSVKDSVNNNQLDTTDFAWVSIYRKTGNGWKIECNISTNK